MLQNQLDIYDKFLNRMKNMEDLPGAEEFNKICDEIIDLDRAYKKEGLDKTGLYLADFVMHEFYEIFFKPYKNSFNRPIQWCFIGPEYLKRWYESNTESNSDVISTNLIIAGIIMHYNNIDDETYRTNHKKEILKYIENHNFFEGYNKLSKYFHGTDFKDIMIF